jgi:Glycosyltransferase WbsX/Capsule polysaccharide biosynthesis protein
LITKRVTGNPPKTPEFVRPTVIAIHLLPFAFRGQQAPYLWIFHTALSKLGPRAAYILSADYLDAGGYGANLSPAERKSLSQASYSLIPDKEMRAFADRYPTRELAWRDYLTKEVPELTAVYERALARLPSSEGIRAVVTWCNCPSLLRACQSRKIQVIHQELGSLRPPGYVPTLYFDSTGVNGNTEVEARYQRLDPDKQQLPVYSRHQLLAILSAGEVERRVAFKHGVALQVEDDSNIIAFSNGYNSTAMVNKAVEDSSAAEVLVRDHPAAHFAYRQRQTGQPARDQSASTLDFLGKIDHLYTINSSLGLEALLHGIPVTCLGEAPYKFISTQAVDSVEFTKRLSFYCLNYLVPTEFLLDEDYLRWRLSSPTEVEIQEKHLHAHAARSLLPLSFAQVFFDIGDGFSEKNSIVRPVSPGRQRLVFDGLPEGAAIKALRLDPLNDHAVVRIESLRFVKAGSEPIAASIASTNADYADAAEFYFMHRDPSVFINIRDASAEGLKQISVDLEVIARGPAEVKDALDGRGMKALFTLQQLTAEREQALIQRDQMAIDLNRACLDRDRVAAELQQMTTQRDQAILERGRIAEELQDMSRDRDRVLSELQQTVAQLDDAFSERGHLRDHLQQMTAQRDQASVERDDLSNDRRLIALDRDRVSDDLKHMTAQRDRAIHQRERAAAERDGLATVVHLIKRTLSWRITAPFRRAGSKLLGRPPQPGYGAAMPQAWFGESGDFGIEGEEWNESAAPGSERLFAQLFVDAGDGFTEDRSLTRRVLTGRHRLVFDGFARDATVRSLRIDPVNDHAVVRIERVLLTSQAGEQSLGKVVPLNAARADATGSWFTHEDPQYVVELLGGAIHGLREVAIDLEIIAVGQAAVAENLRTRESDAPEVIEAPVADTRDDSLEAFEVLSGKEAGIGAVTLERDAARLIAFYLPQYHRVPENSEWWGPGFTEWTNVIKGKPNFEGHVQPHLPRELGFYDLSNVEVMREQAAMAKLYGVHAFCFYYYWFSGRRILEKPVEAFLNSDIDFNYCLCWANENWTRTWDGDTRSVLMEQKYAQSDPEEFIQSLLPYFADRRYIRVQDKPMLVVYRAKEIPNVKAVFAAWRSTVEAAGYPGLHINVVDFYDISHPGEVDADALTEFPPHKFNGVGSNPDLMPAISNPDFQGSVVDYAKVIQQSVGRSKPDFTLYRAAMPSWDNTARRQNTPTILYGSNPPLFREWLHYLRAYSREHGSIDKGGFIFVNAWNEWGEGCHLEPDQATGLGHLEAVAKSAWFDPAMPLQAVRAHTLDAAVRCVAARHPTVLEP